MLKLTRLAFETPSLAGKYSSILSLSLLHFRALGCTSQPLGFSRSFPVRRFLHLATSDRTHDAGVIRLNNYNPSNTSIDDLVRSHSRRSADAWVQLLETYLPRGLQNAPRGIERRRDSAEPWPHLQSLASLLRKARATAKVDLLSHLGVNQGRWEAVIWLVESMLEKCPNYNYEDEPSRRLPVPLLSPQRGSLNELTAHPFNLEPPRPCEAPLNHLLAWDTADGEASALSLERQSLGQIWQSLGCMILQAEDRSAADPSYQAIMSLVLDILAQMHHISALPPNIYNYNPAKDKSVVQRPPTLYLLSARIMTVLSDVAWKKHWISEMAKAKEYGYELPPARVQPQLPPVGTEVWLELVLWACVEGGWISEAAWIISEMERRNVDKDTQWSVISWDEICKAKAPKLEWTAILKLQIDKTRLNQSTGIGIANNGTSNIDMGPRTVSREVILTIMDGVINRASTKANIQGEPVVEVQHYIKSCKSLLERHHSRFGGAHVNAVVLRMIESAVLDYQSSSGTLSRIIDTHPSLNNGPGFGVQADALIEKSGIDSSAAILGLLHTILYHYSESGNLQGSLQTLRDVQNIIDSNRNIYIQDFADFLQRQLKQGGEDSSLVSSVQKRTSPLLYPQIPTYVLARLLDFVVENRFKDLGQWLIYNDDIDGGIIHTHMYDDPNLQPALLGFATATADHELLTTILERLQPPLPSSILHSLLRCQVVLNRWTAVEDILKHFRDSPDLNWSSYDVMTIAAAIFKMSHSPRPSNHLGRALGILKELLQGRYDPSQSKSQLFDPSRIRRANQLKRILCSVPGKPFGNIASDPGEGAKRYSEEVEISETAFNILLDAVVGQLGSAVGRTLWQRWCADPGKAFSPRNSLSTSIEDRDERVVKPTVYMLRTVTRPLAQKLRQRKAEFSRRDTKAAPNNDSTSTVTIHLLISPEDQSMINWAVRLYQKFGLGNKAIDRELPGAMKLMKKRIPP
ncbi:MAG: hypothetical protein Q9163_002624 [Psora crenata]